MNGIYVGREKKTLINDKEKESLLIWRLCFF
jgi:hypothetical protein